MAHAVKRLEKAERARAEQRFAVDWSKLLDADFDEDRVTVQQVASGVPAWVVDGLLSPRECARLIKACEQSKGFGKTPYMKAYRGNTRMMTTDMVLASKVWARIRQFCPPTFKTVESVPNPADLECSAVATRWTPVGLNERWRWAKYWPTDRFARHVDAFFERFAKGQIIKGADGKPFKPPYTERSFLTFNLYLNGHDATPAGLPTFRDGETRFFLSDDAKKPTHLITPKAGRVVLFQQPPHADLLHDGAVVEGGNKYLLRSDVMYRSS